MEKLKRILFYLGAVILICLMSSCKPTAKYDSLGNSQSNIMNGGFMAKHGELTYYNNIDDNGKLYKSDPTGLNQEKLSDDENVSFINAFDDWIFYVDNTEGQGNHIIKVKPDGTQRTEMNDSKTGRLAVIKYTDGMFKLWFIDISDNRKLTVLTDNSSVSQQVLATDVKNNASKSIKYDTEYVNEFTIDPSRQLVYFSTDEGIKAMLLFGRLGSIDKGTTFLFGEYTSIVFHNKRLFYTKVADTKGYISFEGKDTGISYKTLKYKGFEILEKFDYGVAGDYVLYFDADEKTINKMKIDGGEVTQIAYIDEVDTEYNTAIHIIDDKVYFSFMNVSSGEIERRSFNI